MLELKFQNGKMVKYNLKDNNSIDMQIIIQKLCTLSENLYHERTDCVDASFELDKILDDLIEFE